MIVLSLMVEPYTLPGYQDVCRWRMGLNFAEMPVFSSSHGGVFFWVFFVFFAESYLATKLSISKQKLGLTCLKTPIRALSPSTNNN